MSTASQIPVPVPATNPESDTEEDESGPSDSEQQSAATGAYARWTKEQEDELLQFVESRPDESHSISSTLWKDAAMSEILEGRTPTACFSHWFGIRNTGPKPDVTQGRTRGKKAVVPRKSTPTPEVVGTKRNPGSNNSVPRKSSYTPTGRPRGRPAKNRPNANAAASSSTSKKTSKINDTTGFAGAGSPKFDMAFMKACADRLKDQLSIMGSAKGADAWRMKAEVEETRATLGAALKAYQPR